MSVSHRNHLGRVRHWLILVCLPALAWGQADAGEEVFDRAVASIEGSVLTLSQLTFEARVLLVNAGGVRAAFEPLDLTVLRASLDTSVDQRLATLEADKLGSYPLEAGELDRAIVAFRSRFDSEREFQRFLSENDVGLRELEAVLRRSLRAQRVLDGKLRLRAQVSDADARHAQATRPELAKLPLESVRQQLFSARFNELARAELKQARKQANVRLLGPFAPTPGRQP